MKKYKVMPMCHGSKIFLIVNQKHNERTRGIIRIFGLTKDEARCEVYEEFLAKDISKEDLEELCNEAIEQYFL